MPEPKSSSLGGGESKAQLLLARRGVLHFGEVDLLAAPWNRTPDNATPFANTERPGDASLLLSSISSHLSWRVEEVVNISGNLQESLRSGRKDYSGLTVGKVIPHANPGFEPPFLRLRNDP